MASRQKYAGAPWLYDESTGDIIGVKDPDGSEFYFAHTPRLGAFYDTTDQTTLANQANAMTFNTTVVSRGVSVFNGSKLYVDRDGLYNWQISIQVFNSDSQAHFFDIWGKMNGSNIPDSNTRYSVPSSHGGLPGAQVPALNFWMDMKAGDYVQVMWSSESNHVAIQYEGPSTGPVRPAIPSIILTVNEVSL